MAVVCPACGIENREGARFCKGCGGKLTPHSPLRAQVAQAAEWPATEPAPLERGSSAPIRPTSPALPFEDERTVIVSSAGRSNRLLQEVTLLKPSMTGSSQRFDSAPSSRSYSQQSAPPGQPPAAFVAAEDSVPRRHPEALLTLPAPKSLGGRGISVIVLLAVLLAVLVASAGWYWFAGRGPASELLSAGVPAAGAPVATRAVAPAPVPPPTTPATSITTPSLPIPASETAVTAAPAAAPAPSSAKSAVPPLLGTSETRAVPARSTAPAATAKPKKLEAPASMAIAAAPVKEQAQPLSAPAPLPPPAAPQAECAGRNFIAMAQCMVNQCAKVEFQSHPQCDAVRKQQRIDEEKRNPSMAN